MRGWGIGVSLFAAPLLLLAVPAAEPAAAEAEAAYYVPAGRAIARAAEPPTVWETPPRKTVWRAQAIGGRHVEEMHALCALALGARFRGRENEYVLASDGASVRIKAPDDIREAAGNMLGALIAARRMEVGLTLEHYALSRRAASSLDALTGSVMDEDTAGRLASDSREPGNPDVELLGRLGAAGVANDQLVSVNVTPVPVAHLTHSSKSAQNVTYLTAHRGAWASAVVRPAGPTRWHVNLRVLLAWNTAAAPQEAEIAFAVGQAAVTRTASLRLPRWRSLAFCGDLTVPGGKAVLLALVGASDDPAPASPGKPFEAVVLRVDDPLHGTTEGPVAFCSDGSRLSPSVVLERMRDKAREMAEARGRRPEPLEAWCGGSMMLLGDVSRRALCLETLSEILPANDPQRLRVLMGERAPEGLRPGAVPVDAEAAARGAALWWGGDGLVSVASVAAASGRQSCQLDLQAGEVGVDAVGLGQVAATDGITLAAGCTGAGKRRRLAMTASLGVPRAGLLEAGQAQPSSAVSVDRLLEFGCGLLVPAGGRAARGAAICQQLGPVVEAESPSGTVADFQPAQM